MARLKLPIALTSGTASPEEELAALNQSAAFWLAQWP